MGNGKGERGAYAYDFDQFSERSIRHEFIRKVMFVVMIQIAITCGIVCIFMFVETVKFWVFKNSWIVFVFMAVTLILMLLIGCVQSIRRSYPINVVLLFIFTCAEGGMIGVLCARTYPMIVLYAFGLTILLCASLILFAFQTRCDFTGIGPFLLIGVVILVVMGIVAIFIHDRILIIVLSSLGIFLFSLYLIVDIQMMVGGTHKYQYDPEDWVMAAISIYVDIITIFIYILALLGIVMDD